MLAKLLCVGLLISGCVKQGGDWKIAVQHNADVEVGSDCAGTATSRGPGQPFTTALLLMTPVSRVHLREGLLVLLMLRKEDL